MCFFSYLCITHKNIQPSKKRYGDSAHPWGPLLETLHVTLRLVISKEQFGEVGAQRPYDIQTPYG